MRNNQRDRRPTQPRLPFSLNKPGKRKFPKGNPGQCARCQTTLGQGPGAGDDPLATIGYRVWTFWGWRSFCPPCSDQASVGNWPLNLLRRYKPHLYRQYVKELRTAAQTDAIPTPSPRFTPQTKSPRKKHLGSWRKLVPAKRLAKPQSMARKMGLK